MKSNKFSLLFCAVLGLFFAISTAAQTQTFSDVNVEYTFDVPNTTWKMTAKPSTTSPNVEYVYGDRMHVVPYEKDKEFDYAPNGILGLETSLAVTLDVLVRQNKFKLSYVVDLMTRPHTNDVRERGTGRDPGYGLGWGLPWLGRASPSGALSFGHTGATGSTLIVDPANDLVVVYLRNDWSAPMTLTDEAVQAVYGALD